MTSPADWLLEPDEPEAAAVINAGGRSRYVLLCEHASPRFPRRLGTLGLSAADRARHIAWDIGAGATARRLAARLDAPLVVQEYSRLVCDCNRDPANPDFIVIDADGARVTGNADLTAAERAQRRAAIYDPFHGAVGALLDARLAAGQRTCVIGVHSFTPRLGPSVRPWHVGILYPEACPLSAQLLDRLGRVEGLVVGDNQPYSLLTDHAETMVRHGQRRRLQAAEIEVRQDLVGDEAGCERWAARIAAALMADAAA